MWFGAKEKAASPAFLPRSTDSLVRMFFMYWRIAERALAVVTKVTQFGFGFAPRAVMISTVWPFSSAVRNGTSWRSILPA